MGSNHTLMIRITPTEVSQVIMHQFPSLPCIIVKFRLLLTTNIGRKNVKKPLPCSSSTRRDNHQKKPHRNDRKTYGNSKTKFDSSCINNALWSLHYKFRESVMTYHVIIPPKNQVSYYFLCGRLTLEEY